MKRPSVRLPQVRLPQLRLPRLPEPRVRERSSGSGRRSWPLLAPALVVLLLVTALPLGRAIWTSLSVSSLTTPDDTTLVGVDNYVDVLTSRDWWSAVALTLLFVFVVVVAQLLLGAGFAGALRRITIAAPYTRAFVLVPFVLMATVAAFAWRQGLTEGFGPSWFHYDGDGRTTALVSMAVTEIWRGTGITAVILLAGLRRVPPTLLDSAVADGATARQRLLRVVLPAAGPAIAVAVVYRSLDAFRAFEAPILAEPSLSDLRTAPLLLWDTTFTSFELGLGAAMSVLVLLLAGLIAVALVAVLRVRRVL